MSASDIGGGAGSRPQGRRLGWPGLLVAVVTTVGAVVVIARTVDVDLLVGALGRAADRPGPVVLAVVGFAVAFVLRALAWRQVLPGLALGQAWSAIHVALGANHLLPLRLGEPFRVLSVVRRAGVPLDVAAASTVGLRSADLLTLLALGAAVAPVLFVRLVGPLGWLVLGLVAVVAGLSWRWLARLATGARSGVAVRLPGGSVIVLSVLAWLAESVVVREAARLVGIDLGWREAVLVATVAVGAQVAAIAPGGLGTYEAASVAAYVALGHDAGPALVAALAAHGLKTAYALGAGALALFWPAPGMLGRFRLPPGGGAARSAPPPLGEEAADGPVVLFMPAFNEGRSVGACVARAPASVAGRPVQVLVIDDGSTDDTAVRAAEAGAEVLSLGVNRGLGAAVRIGLAEAGARRAVAVAFCDADGEYPPEELESLVRPILAGEADYVAGSRFTGRIDRMRPHRRVGNVVLTRLLSLIARRPISDGQTGYRAFSPAAAASAEIIHDFNYAQVLTLDLLAKGFRYREVPISYHFRTEGESFVRLGPYLRTVVPAIYRELNHHSTPPRLETEVVS